MCLEDFEDISIDGELFNNLYDVISTDEMSEVITADVSDMENISNDILLDITENNILESIEEMFRYNDMYEHSCSVRLLGDLGYADMLIYYSAVMDYFMLQHDKEEGTQEYELATPETYVDKKEDSDCSLINIKCECKTKTLFKLKRVIDNLLNKEFKLLSNTYLLDGTDIICFIVFKSVVGYAIRMKIVIKCENENEMEILKTQLGVD